MKGVRLRRNGQLVAVPNLPAPAVEEKQYRGKQKTCLDCYAGILLHKGTVQPCSHCGLFWTQEDAELCVQMLLKLLQQEYMGKRSTDTVAEAMIRLAKRRL